MYSQFPLAFIIASVVSLYIPVNLLVYHLLHFFSVSPGVSAFSCVKLVLSSQSVMSLGLITFSYVLVWVSVCVYCFLFYFGSPSSRMCYVQFCFSDLMS